MNKPKQTTIEEIAKDLTNYVSDQYIKLDETELKYLCNQFYSRIYRGFNSELDSLAQEVIELNKTKFPLGKRKWCLECAERFTKEVLQLIRERGNK